jgi:hypothetical protein
VAKVNDLLSLLFFYIKKTPSRPLQYVLTSKEKNLKAKLAFD